MIPIDANELLDLQTEANNVLDKTATVTRISTDAPDSVGGRTRSTSTFTVACKLLHKALRREGANETPTDRASVNSVWLLLVPFGTGVRITDKVAVGALNFSVIRPDNERSTAIYETVTLNLTE